MRHVSLFSGIGMLDLAVTAAGFDTIATAELDPFCRKVLEARFPDAEYFEDVADVTADSIESPVALVTGGFPCQDISRAGLGKGLEGERSGLWREFVRVLSELKPCMALIENVSTLKKRGLDHILYDLWRLGYSAQWDCIPAAAVGAPHLRDRIFIAAVRDCRGGPDPLEIIGYAERWTVTNHGHRVGELPRAGVLYGGVVYATEPRSTVSTSRQRALAGGKLLPTPTTQDGENNGGPAQLRRRSWPLNAYVKLYPTPTAADGRGGANGNREGGPNLRTVMAQYEGSALLKPEFVEWMMGVPEGWSDPCVSNDDLLPFAGWDSPEPTPRTVTAETQDRGTRSKRIRALGNGAVPQCVSVGIQMIFEMKGGRNAPSYPLVQEVVQAATAV